MPVKPWPEDWPEYYNGSELCDMLVGPCSCGAGHSPGEFRFDGTFLYRYGKPVVIKNGKIVTQNKITLEELEKQRDLLDAEIKKQRILAKIKWADSFTIYMNFRNRKEELHFIDVKKLRHFLVEAANE